MWFEIKFEPLYKDGPKHMLTSVKLFRSLSTNIQEIVGPHIKRNAYFAHSENILMAMLADTNLEMRQKAIGIITDIRQGSVFGDDSPRQFNVPKLNFSAGQYDELIDWKNERIYESVITAQISTSDLQKIEHEPFFIGKFECHTQAIERTVKEVTKASKAVVGRDRRDGCVKSTLKSRKFHPKSNTKKDLLNLVKPVDVLSSEEE